MTVVYVGTCPYDPELELKNFQRNQAEYEAAWYATSDPQVLFEALRHARAARQPPPDWLVTAMGNYITKSRAKGKRKGKASRTVERLQDRMNHVRRYRCVRDLYRNGRTREDALDLAVEQLAAIGEAAAPPTIEDSYNRVSRDLKRKGHKSEYFILVARSDPTVVPVSVIQTSDGVTINGVFVAQRPQGVTRGPAVTRSDSGAPDRP